MDPFSVATGAAGLLSLAFDIARILSNYINDVQNAPQDARDLLAEITALSHVLEQLVEFLRSEAVKGKSFDQTSVLRSLIIVCQSSIERLYKTLNKPRSQSGRARLIERFRWPLCKDDCQKTMGDLHRFSQTFQFSLTISNWLAP